MGIAVIKNDNEITYGVKSLICDTAADANSLSTSYKPGSVAFCIEDSSKRVLGTDKVWHKISSSGGSSASIDTIDDDTIDTALEGF